MAGQEYHRHRDALALESCLQVAAGWTRQTHIKQQAARAIGQIKQELACGSICVRLVAGRPEQPRIDSSSSTM